MLEDRDYMRQPDYDEPRWRPRFHLRWSWTATLLVVYAVVFVAEMVTVRFAPGSRFFGRLALSKEGLEHGYVWQLVTYQFMHAGLMHLVLNCWMIYTFGRELESLIGPKRFFALLFSSGIIGGVFQVLTALAWPGMFGGTVVGASACGFGLVAAYAMIYPERELTMLVFFIIPVHLRAKTLLIFFAVLAMMGIVFHEYIMPGVAHAAHLGGMAMGWLYVSAILKQPSLEVGAEAGTYSRPKAEKAAEPSAGEFLESEVDPILDKISARGIQSLTARERAVLEAARKKMTQH